MAGWLDACMAGWHPNLKALNFDSLFLRVINLVIDPSCLLVLLPQLLHLLPSQGLRSFFFRKGLNGLIWVDLGADPVLGEVLVPHPAVAIDVH
jgi:hypothetical protein